VEKEVRFIGLEVSIKSQVVEQIKTTNIVVKDIDVRKVAKYFHFIFSHFTRISGMESKIRRG
jgi:hypothetical protein